MRRLFLLSICAAAAGSMAMAELATSVVTDDLPEKKRTELGLYQTSLEAGAALEADPSIVFIDVRDPGEAQFVGLPRAVDAIVPLRLVSHDFDPAKGAYKMTLNPEFLAQVEAVMAREGKGPEDVVFVSCQSGGRTAKAVDALARAGYTKAYALFEGIEGDLNKETGMRDLNGWKNAGLPWSYKIAPQQAWPATY